MGFVKVIKNRAYFKRYQVKFRRRRECKIDYFARKRLILQDKNKYDSPKYRFVVRVSNKDITCQIISADLDHDVCIASAYSHELTRYGVKVGLTNYAAAYCTGLLLARRLNSKFKLNYAGVTEIDGTCVETAADPEGAAPFRAFMDVGLAVTTTGAKIFGALKGASDGGLYIPHNARRFPGTQEFGKGKWKPSPEKTRARIFGEHVANKMRSMEEASPEKYQRHFSRFIKEGISADDLEDMYTKAHAAIRAEPFKKRGDLEKGSFGVRDAPVDPNSIVKKYWGQKKISNQQRKNRIRQKLSARGIVSAPLLTFKNN
jgi:large subunit ribosomal protein L5e